MINECTDIVKISRRRSLWEGLSGPSSLQAGVVHGPDRLPGPGGPDVGVPVHLGHHDVVVRVGLTPIHLKLLISTAMADYYKVPEGISSPPE